MVDDANSMTLSAALLLAAAALLLGIGLGLTASGIALGRRPVRAIS
jgi:hypothetical protein